MHLIQDPNCLVAKITVEELSHLTCATLNQTQHYLQQLIDANIAAISAKTIKFYGKDDLAEIKMQKFE